MKRILNQNRFILSLYLFPKIRNLLLFVIEYPQFRHEESH